MSASLLFRFLHYQAYRRTKSNEENSVLEVSQQFLVVPKRLMNADQIEELRALLKEQVGNTAQQSAD